MDPGAKPFSLPQESEGASPNKRTLYRPPNTYSSPHSQQRNSNGRHEDKSGSRTAPIQRTQRPYQPPTMASKQSLGSQGEQNMFIIRHAPHESVWRNAGNLRAFDPVITQAGEELSHKLGASLPPIKYVITSPFTCCIQTAIAISTEQKEEKVLPRLDNGLSPPYNSTVLNTKTQVEILTPKELENTFSGRLDLDVPSPVPMPQWGETAGKGGEAGRRLTSAITRIGDQYAGSDIALVTHLDGLQAAVKRIIPNVCVYRTDYCCYLHLRRTEGSQWFIAGQEGVEWMAESALPKGDPHSNK